jgi:UDP-N-acetylmuramoyl-tripeptide--D-alanyl-D-alanine ligase
MMSIDQLHAVFLQCTGISIDSRTVSPGDLFIAIRGPNFNANSYAEEAISKGARYAIVDDESVVISDHYILVDSGIVALQELAKFHRLQFSDLKIIAVAGSNGKTTTKELVSLVLKQSYNVLATSGNFNNHIGVPLTLLNLTSSHDIAVIEMGANHIGEHEFLCGLVDPNYAIVTNCGKDHLEGYGSLQGVIESNQEVYDYIRQTNGLVFVSSDDATLLGMTDGLECIYYGQNSALQNNVSLLNYSVYPQLNCIIKTSSRSEISIKTKLYGEYNAKNILAAVCIGQYFDASNEQIKFAIESYTPTNNRSQQLTWQNCTVYLDAYNANPTSMAEFCHFISTVKSSHKIIIFGAMEELGSQSIVEHKALIDQVTALGVEHVFLVGAGFKAHESDDVTYFDSYQNVKDHMSNLNLSNSSIFVKGSRKYTLEKIFDL